MAIEVISFYVLGLILVSAVSFIAGGWKYKTDIKLLEADLNGQKKARAEQCRRYDELYDAFLRVNKMNTDLSKQLNHVGSTYETCADGMVDMLNKGISRKDIAVYYKVPYPTACLWMRRKLLEKNKFVKIQKSLI